MASFNAPRRGSMAFYPRVRAKKETPSIKSKIGDNKAGSFLGYKVGMIQVAGKNSHKGNVGFGQDIIIPATIIACPEMKVIGIRAYKKRDLGEGAVTEIIAENLNKNVKRKIKGTGKKSQKDEKKKGFEEIEKNIENIDYFTLIISTQPEKIDLKKKPDIPQINIGGNKEEQLTYAKENLGKEINIENVFEKGTFLDVKGVTKGKGFQGVIKRFNVRIQRPKAKKRRIVGSISPWNPSTVMFTVGRPGQMGYHNRTEYNKTLMKIDEDEKINGKSGFSGFGKVKGKYIIVKGSIPGPSKRCVAIRKSIRPERKRGAQIEEIEETITK